MNTSYRPKYHIDREMKLSCDGMDHGFVGCPYGVIEEIDILHVHHGLMEE